MRPLVKSAILFAFGICLGLGSMPSRLSAALQVASYDANVNERLNGSANFIGAGYDWSGVGQTSDGRWVTMISDEYFISVGHYHPVAGTDNVRFYLSDSLSGGFEDYTVDTSFGIQLMTDQGLSDIWIGRLTSTASSNIATYNIFDPLGDPNLLEGENAFVVGNSGQGAYQNFRVGTNVLDLDDGILGVAERSVSVVNGWSATEVYDADVLYDTFFQSGDSGAPTFIVNNGVLELVGVHSVAGTITLPGGNEQVSIDSLVSGYRQEILGIITPVPEPGGVVLVLGAAAFLTLRRRRTRSA